MSDSKELTNEDVALAYRLASRRNNSSLSKETLVRIDAQEAKIGPASPPALSHIEQIVIAVQVAVRTLLSAGNTRIVEQASEHANIVAYFSNSIIIVEVRPRFDNHVPTQTVAQQK